MTRYFWANPDVMRLAVRYTCKECKEEIGTVRRNTNFVDDEGIIWTLRVTTGPGTGRVTKDINDLRSELRRSGGKGDFTVADIDYIDVGIGSQGRAVPDGPGPAWVAPYCVHCAFALERITAGRARLHLQKALSSKSIEKKKLNRAR